jgi:cell division protease FtsH
MNRTQYRRLILFLLAPFALIMVLWAFNLNATPSTDISMTKLATDIKDGKVSEVEVSGDGRELTITYKDDTTAASRTTDVSSLEEILSTYGVDETILSNGSVIINYNSPSPFSNIFAILLGFLPVILIVGFFYFMYRQSQGANNQANAFGKSKARMFTGDHPTVTFDDVAGVEEAKEELMEVVEFLKQPEKFVQFGARIPKGVMLVGAPGTGKTLLAKAVSGEAGVPFFSIAGSEFVEMFVGVGASRVRDLFETAKRHSPCIIFIDEIDAVGRQRGAGLGGSHDEREQTLNQILVEMDGFDTDTAVIIVAATNRPDILDPALLRPGRFDRRVVVDRPDRKGREAIFRVHMRGKPVAKNVNVEILAKATPGFSGADIENTVNEAALLSARRNRRNIGMPEFHEAVERVQMGPERKSRIISPQEREITAYHEAGHAIVSHLLPYARAIRKITIIPRGMSGGATWYLDDDQIFMSESQFRAYIASALGGRIAEELVFGEITTGASSDLRTVTKMAQAMVTQYGMSSNLGLRVYGERQEMVFLGREISEQRDYSDAVAEKIDAEVGEIIDTEYAHARKLLEDNFDKLELIAQTLLEIESLDAEEFAALMDGKEPPASPPSETPPQPTPQPSNRRDWEPPTLNPSPSPA